MIQEEATPFAPAPVAGDAVIDIDEEEVPLAVIDSESTVTEIEDEDTPLAAPTLETASVSTWWWSVAAAAAGLTGKGARDHRKRKTKKDDSNKDKE